MKITEEKKLGIWGAVPAIRLNAMALESANMNVTDEKLVITYTDDKITITRKDKD